MKNTSAHGDQYVTVQIEVPKYLNPEAKQKLKSLKQHAARRTDTEMAVWHNKNGDCLKRQSPFLNHFYNQELSRSTSVASKTRC